MNSLMTAGLLSTDNATAPSRSILITGCSSGIGLASAQVMKARGWRVLAAARKTADMERLHAEVGVEPIPLELTDDGSIADCAEEALRRTDGKLTALFNNAAYGQVGAIEDLSADVLRQQLEVNLIGTHELTRRIIPAMRRNGGGRIVNCSSVLGLMAAPYRGAYSVSKFALEALSDAMRIELRGSGISVSLIEPGPIRTRFVETALETVKAIDMERSPHKAAYAARIAAMKAGGQQTFKLEPEAVTKRLIHALESRRPRARYYVTTPAYAVAFLRRVLPQAALDRLAAKA